MPKTPNRVSSTSDADIALSILAWSATSAFLTGMLYAPTKDTPFALGTLLAGTLLALLCVGNATRDPSSNGCGPWALTKTLGLSAGILWAWALVQLSDYTFGGRVESNMAIFAFGWTAHNVLVEPLVKLVREEAQQQPQAPK